MLTFKSQRWLRKSKIETDLGANLAKRSLISWLDFLAGFDEPALFEDRPILEFKVEQMQLLITLRDGAVIVDPYKTVLDALAVRVIARLVNTNRDEYRVLFCILL